MAYDHRFGHELSLDTVGLRGSQQTVALYGWRLLGRIVGVCCSSSSHLQHRCTLSWPSPWGADEKFRLWISHSSVPSVKKQVFAHRLGKNIFLLQDHHHYQYFSLKLFQILLQWKHSTALNRTLPAVHVCGIEHTQKLVLCKWRKSVQVSFAVRTAWCHAVKGKQSHTDDRVFRFPTQKSASVGVFRLFNNDLQTTSQMKNCHYSLYCF